MTESEPRLAEAEAQDSAVEDEDGDESRPRTPNDLNEVHEVVLGQLSPRWRNLVIRGFSGLGLISGFVFLVWLGPPGLLFLSYLVVTSSFKEILALGIRFTSKSGQSGHKAVAWSTFAALVYFLNAEAVFARLGFVSLVRFHELISASLYVGLVLVRLVTLLASENNEDHLGSFGLLAWSHVTLAFTVVPCHLLNVTMLRGGLLWYVLPMTLITLNDIAAYYVGFFFGKTPLIKLSPKKTWEGFLGGGLITVVVGALMAQAMANTPLLACPIDTATLTVRSCELADADFYIHGVVISLLCSLIGPFAGFLASGFKRGCNRKNFGSVIPGHGGVTDRCDCMFLCAVIIHVYFHTFIQTQDL